MFGDEAHYGRQDTLGMDLSEESGLDKDKTGTYYFPTEEDTFQTSRTTQPDST